MPNLKILYAAGNNYNSGIQLSRFLEAVKDKNYLIKIAAYKKSFPHNHYIDWTLDCVLNMFTPNFLSLDSDNFQIYFRQVKYFNPDLIISDLEYFSSRAANILNVPLWQASSSLINFSLTNEEKYNLGLFKKYGYLYNGTIHTQKNVNLIDISEKNFIYSHLCDLDISPQIKDNKKFIWARPYHSVGKISKPCKHNIVSILNNEKNISILETEDDCVIFSRTLFREKFNDLIIKDLSGEKEYFCNLKNCNKFICEGQTSFLADAFYNDKYSYSVTDLKDLESLTNSIISEKFGISHMVYNKKDLLKDEKPVSHTKKQNIFYLHEHIENTYG